MYTCLNHILAPRSRPLGRLWPAADDDDDDENGFCLIRAWTAACVKPWAELDVWRVPSTDDDEEDNDNFEDEDDKGEDCDVLWKHASSIDDV